MRGLHLGTIHIWGGVALLCGGSLSSQGFHSILASTHRKPETFPAATTRTISRCGRMFPEERPPLRTQLAEPSHGASPLCMAPPVLGAPRRLSPGGQPDLRAGFMGD